MGTMSTKELMRLTHKEIYEEKRDWFLSLGDRGRYSEAQKRYAFALISEHGMRATARILEMPRRTLQRWCRKQGVCVKRCPGWVYKWAEGRRRRKQFWQDKGYN
ncbi:MAG: hypothetical protein PVJ86_06160 [Phycisphaerales bacterium]|jgi:hypothetical protein